MSAEELSIQYHGRLLPKETHSPDSLKFAQDFKFKDDDVLSVTYPKSGQCFCPKQQSAAALQFATGYLEE